MKIRLLLALSVLLLPMASSVSSPAQAQVQFRNGDVHPFYTAYTYRNGDWVRYEEVTSDEPREDRTMSLSSPGPGWIPEWHYRFFTRQVENSWWDPNGGTQVIVGYEPVQRPNPASWHSHGSHPCAWEYDVWIGPGVSTTVCGGRVSEFHSHGTYIGYDPIYGQTGEQRTSVTTQNTSDQCPGADDCGGHTLPGWTYTGHDTQWVLNYLVAVTRTVTYSCGSACTTVFVPTNPPVPEGMEPSVPEFDVSWRLDVTAPSPLLAQGAFADQEVRISGATLLCDGRPCDDPSLYEGSDFLVRPRPGGLSGSLSFLTQEGFEACVTAVQPGCDVFFPSRSFSGSLLGSGTISARIFSPPGSGQGLALLLSPSSSEADLWRWEPQLTFVPDPSGACTPTLDGCIRAGTWVASGPPVPQFDRKLQVPATLRLLSTFGQVVTEVEGGEPLVLRVVGTVGS